MTHQNRDHIEILSSIPEVVLSTEKLTQVVEMGILSPLDHIRELYCYQLTADPATFRRLFPSALHYLDHFWLLLPVSLNKQQQFWNQFYRLYSADYEGLINPSHNLMCLKYFKQLIEERVRISPEFKLLDYGCGPGFSADVFHLGGLIGYDINPDMLAQAKARKQTVLDQHEFRFMPPDSIDGCIACYVFHMAIPHEDILHIANLVKCGGLVVANYYKGIGAKRITDSFLELGFEAEQVGYQEGEFGSVYIYRKQ